MNKLEQMALNMMGKQHPFKRRVTKAKKTTEVPRYKPGRSIGRQHKLLEDIRKGEKVFISTLDVEMSKWRFKEATGVELILTQSVNTTIYKCEINE